MRIRSLLILALLGSLAAGGCIFSPSEGGGKPPPPPDLCAANPDALMELFREIYGARDIDSYREILSQDFLYIAPNETYGYDVEIDITTKMFTEQVGEGGIVFKNITVDQLEPQGPWQDTDPDDENFGGFEFGSQFRSYLVDFNFYVSGVDLRYRVRGPVVYYVKQETENGKTCYKYLGMIDLTFGNSGL